MESKTDQMARTLSQIMKKYKIEKTEYMIIAGYGLRNYREVTDLDVAVSRNAYDTLKRSGKFEVDLAKISGTERLCLKLPTISEDAEIEFFELEDHGFPANTFSLRNMQEKNSLIDDLYKNPYMKSETVAQFYNVIMVDEKLMNWDYEINKERLEKNITHLKLLQKNVGTLDIQEQIESMASLV